MKKTLLLISFLFLASSLFIPEVFAQKKTKSTTKKSEVTQDKSKSSETVQDIDGNVYHTVTIGTQTWMVENLKTTKYLNGDAIPNVIYNTAWAKLTIGAYCNYGNDASNAITYGRLYNWYAVNDSRNIAPTGWHVPSDEEWTTLITYLGGASVARGKLKEAGTTHWLSPDTSATNETGFTALPGGSRRFDGIFNNIGNGGYCWSSTTEDYRGHASHRYMILPYMSSGATTDRTYGYSVRCVKDN